MLCCAISRCAPDRVRRAPAFTFYVQGLTPWHAHGSAVLCRVCCWRSLSCCSGSASASIACGASHVTSSLTRLGPAAGSYLSHVMPTFSVMTFEYGSVQETGTTCRERCGGQGYLSVNRFGHIIGFSHAGMTAEGDNRVLMQKACHAGSQASCMERTCIGRVTCG